MVMDIMEDVEFSLIFGRLFMLTSKTIVNMGEGKLTTKVRGDQIIFNVFDIITHPNDDLDYFRVDIFDEVIDTSGIKCKFLILLIML